MSARLSLPKYEQEPIAHARLSALFTEGLLLEQNDIKPVLTACVAAVAIEGEAFECVCARCRANAGGRYSDGYRWNYGETKKRHDVDAQVEKFQQLARSFTRPLTAHRDYVARFTALPLVDYREALRLAGNGSSAQLEAAPYSDGKPGQLLPHTHYAGFDQYDGWGRDMRKPWPGKYVLIVDGEDVAAIELTREDLVSAKLRKAASS